MVLSRTRKVLILVLFALALLMVGLNYFSEAVSGYTTFSYDESKVFASVLIAVMLIVGFPCLMAFPKRYAFGGLGFGFFLSVYSFAGALSLHCFHLRDSNAVLMESLFTMTTILITFSGLEGFTSLWQNVIVASVEIIGHVVCVYCVNNFFDFFDVGGSTTIHMYGALFGLATSAGIHIVNRKLEKVEKRSMEVNSLPSFDENGYVGDQFAFFGTLVLWALWPVFASGPTTSSVAVVFQIFNTLVCLSGSTISAILFSMMVKHEEVYDWKIDPVDAINWTLAGGVFCGTFLGVVENSWVFFLGGYLIGTLSVITSTYLSPLIERKLGIRDTCGILNLHGIPGFLGGIMTMVYIYANERTWEVEIIYTILAMGIPAIVLGLLVGFIVARIDRVREEVTFDDAEAWTGFVERKIPEVDYKADAIAAE
eukprot:gnl/Chilomastix_cuspidata/199.p1 GENE.gnl/Chilomastix_cuspidata/199~~gnl/Chilomastix_cuspidata/199.p1  ORF type:complete len:436 (+),score=95.98 gnl/Chilomastix_cuspidata/199:35-1309(+)